MKSVASKRSSVLFAGLLIASIALAACGAPATSTPTPAIAPTAEPAVAPTEAPTEAPTQAPAPTAEPMTAATSRTVTDSRGVKVEIPAEVKTVATISDALVEEVMYALGVDAKVNVIGATCLVRDFVYDFTSAEGEKFSYFGGMNPANYLSPYLRDLEFFIESGTEMNFETLAKAEPDVLFIHAGCCTVNWKTGDDQKMNSTLDKLEELGIPTVVLYGPNFSGEPSIEALSEEVRIIGEVFGKQEQAAKLADYLVSQITLVSERTKEIPEDEKQSVLLFGLNPNVRADGGSGTVFGLQDIQSYMLEEIVHAKNAFQDDSYSKPLNAEQVLALDPDAIVLPTANGYHPPRELYDTADFKNLETMRAIQERRIAALPWSPCNCDQRLEYPVNVMVMAKTAYPDLFKDIDLESWLADFFKNVYGVDDDTAQGLIDAVWMDWTRDQQ